VACLIAVNPFAGVVVAEVNHRIDPGEVVMSVRAKLLVAPVLLIGLVSCSMPAAQGTPPAASTSAAASASASAPAAPAAAPAVKVSTTSVGPVLTDQTGRTLYAFTKDKNKPAACDADCVAVWPVFGGRAVAGAGTDGSLLGQVKEGDDSTQVSYNGWPLYYYVADDVPGDVNGVGVDGAWFPVAANGSLVKVES